MIESLIESLLGESLVGSIVQNLDPLTFLYEDSNVFLFEDGNVFLFED